MTHNERTVAALALAQEATEILGEIILAVIDYSGAGRIPTFTIYDEINDRYHVEDLDEEDIIAYVVEHLDLAAAVAADPETYHPDTLRAFGVVTEAMRAASEEAAWIDEIEAEAVNELALAREREARDEYLTARDEAIYGPSEPLPW